MPLSQRTGSGILARRTQQRRTEDHHGGGLEPVLQLAEPTSTVCSRPPPFDRSATLPGARTCQVFTLFKSGNDQRRTCHRACHLHQKWRHGGKTFFQFLCLVRTQAEPLTQRTVTNRHSNGNSESYQQRVTANNTQSLVLDLFNSGNNTVNSGNNTANSGINTINNRGTTLTQRTVTNRHSNGNSESYRQRVTANNTTELFMDFFNTAVNNPVNSGNNTVNNRGNQDELYDNFNTVEVIQGPINALAALNSVGMNRYIAQFMARL
jgi:hypothetical protein